MAQLLEEAEMKTPRANANASASAKNLFSDVRMDSVKDFSFRDLGTPPRQGPSGAGHDRSAAEQEAASGKDEVPHPDLNPAPFLRGLSKL